MSMRGSKTFRKRNLWQAEQFSRSIGEQHEYPRKSVIADRIAVAEFKRELCHHREPDFGSWEWELARHRGLWNYWREEDEFCDAMHQRFPIPD